MRQITGRGLVITATGRLLPPKTESNSVMGIAPRAKFGCAQNVNHVMAKQPMSGPINPIVSIIAWASGFTKSALTDVFGVITQPLLIGMRILNRVWPVRIGIWTPEGLAIIVGRAW